MNQQLIEQAIANNRKISFYYEGISGLTQRIVRPQTLGIKKNGTLHVVGIQEEGGSGIGIRDFKLDKITDLTILSETFTPDGSPANTDRWQCILAEAR